LIYRLDYITHLRTDKAHHWQNALLCQSRRLLFSVNPAMECEGWHTLFARLFEPTKKIPAPTMMASAGIRHLAIP